MFGVSRWLSQTRRRDAPAVREVFGDAVHFVAVVDWGNPDRARAWREGFLEEMMIWHREFGSRVVKFWAAPRLWEIVGGDPRDVVPLDSPWRVRAAGLARDLGMMIMTHVGDPDTWFRTRYADTDRFGRKADAYLALERMLDRFPLPWIAAHMGGSPEDLDFLDGLLERHPNLYLDTSATKWVVRELSKHPRPRVREFFARWRGRVLFGSDVVVLEDHVAPQNRFPGTRPPAADLASNEDEAFDLYASRYYALRLLLETEHEGESPIADPDLAMIEPARFGPMSAPRLQGVGLDADLLRTLYRDAPESVVGRWVREHGGRWD